MTDSSGNHRPGRVFKYWQLSCRRLSAADSDSFVASLAVNERQPPIQPLFQQ
jgi:hypothetical protein